MAADDFFILAILGLGGYVIYKKYGPKTATAPRVITSASSGQPIAKLTATAVIIDPKQAILNKYQPETPYFSIKDFLSPGPINTTIPTIGGSTLSKAPLPSSFLTPDGALNVIKSGQIGHLRGQRISNYFYWGEVFHSRSDAEVKAILNPANNHLGRSAITILTEAAQNARTLDAMRVKWNKPLTVSSWYRGLAANRAAGGASDSRHLYGDSTDLQFSGASEAQRFYNMFNSGYNGGLGQYGGSRSNIIHVDSRGTRARWKHA